MEPSHPWWEEHWLINVFLQPRVLPPLSAATAAMVGGLQLGKASLLTQPRGQAEQGSLTAFPHMATANSRQTRPPLNPPVLLSS